jgi:hypothetical protein
MNGKREDHYITKITLVDMMQRNYSEIPRFQHLQKLSSLKNCKNLLNII